MDANTAQKQNMIPEGAALLRLMTWLSPAFPIGAFSYSHGLETAIAAGAICSRDSLMDWLVALITCGSGWSDSVLLAQSWHNSQGELDNLLSLNDYALALCPSAERLSETSQLGNAFLKASLTWPTPFHDALMAKKPANIALPVIVGAVAKAHGIPLDVILPAAQHSFVANLISVGIRLVPLGQSDGLFVQATLESTILNCTQRAATTSLDDLGTLCLTSEIAAMQHETLPTRVFKS